jgi:thioredoxin 1
MHSLTLDTSNRDAARRLLDGGRWIVACLCAAWCGTCVGYRAAFEQLAARHPDKTFVWIDIEDQADVVGDLDVDNFPTLLLQRGRHGGLLRHHAARSQAGRAPGAGPGRAGAGGTGAPGDLHQERRDWQRDCNLHDPAAPRPVEDNRRAIISA